VHVVLEPRPERIRQLGADLVGLVGRVDVPRWIRARRATALPRN
jgi:hypothetical protein